MEILARNLDRFRIKEACDALGVSRSAWYRHQRPKRPDRRRPPRKLQEGERAEVLATLNSQTYQDESVPSAHTSFWIKGPIYAHSVQCTVFYRLKSRSGNDGTGENTPSTRSRSC